MDWARCARTVWSPNRGFGHPVRYAPGAMRSSRGLPAVEVNDGSAIVALYAPAGGTYIHWWRHLDV